MTAGATTAASAREPVALVVVNARIRTGDARRPWADALVVRGDRVAAVGGSAELRKLAGAARVIDAARGAVVPARSAGAAAAPGTIVRGGPADFLVLDGDAPPDPSTAPDPGRIVVTVAGGRVVHERDPHTEPRR